MLDLIIYHVLLQQNLERQGVAILQKKGQRSKEHERVI